MKTSSCPQTCIPRNGIFNVFQLLNNACQVIIVRRLNLNILYIFGWKNSTWNICVPQTKSLLWRSHPDSLSSELLSCSWMFRHRTPSPSPWGCGCRQWSAQTPGCCRIQNGNQYDSRHIWRHLWVDFLDCSIKHHLFPLRGPPVMVGLANPRTTNCSMRPVLARWPRMSSSRPEVVTAPGSDASVTRSSVTMLTGDWCWPELHTTSFDMENSFRKIKSIFI